MQLKSIQSETADQPIVLLTGASRGIGHATVKLFSERGWRVLTVSRKAFPEDCAWLGARANHIQADLSDLGAVGSLVDEVRSRLPEGKLHALINNAGISPKLGAGARLGIRQTEAETWGQVLNVNLLSAALLTRGLLPELELASGAVVNITSIAGSRVHPFAGAAYAASKAALSALTREMAAEFAAVGVRANAVAPGEIETAILSKGTDELVARNVPMKRLGDPGEVAETIHFLCVRSSSYITGAEIHINGGQHV